MTRFIYEYATTDGEQGRFHVDEHSESIANVEAKLHVERAVNVNHLTRFDLVCTQRAPT